MIAAFTNRLHLGFNLSAIRPKYLTNWYGFCTIETMKNAIKEVLREFYQEGLPTDIVHRDVED